MNKNRLSFVFAPAVAVVWNLLLAFIVYQIARYAYYLENTDYLTYTSDIFRGGLVFDTTAILYTNALYIVMMLFPLHWKENAVYHRICKIIFVVVNSIAMAINLMDSVYFQYTMRRTTTTVFGEFQNESNLGGIFGREFLSHWYLVILFVVVVVALWKCYAQPRVDFQKQAHKWLYYVACVVSLLVAIPLAVAGIRGGFSTAVRPITISNANQYAARPVDAALVLNTPFSLIRTIGKDVFTIPNYFSSEELEAIYSPVHRPSTRNHGGSEVRRYGGTGVRRYGGTEVRGYEDTPAADTSRTTAPPYPRTSVPQKNVVILIVESFGREYIGALNKSLDHGTYKGYTPCVDSLISQSTTFKYSYCNGRKSIDGMPSILCSIPMFVEPFILTPASMNTFTGLAGLLADEGYETAFFHGAQNGSMGFQAFANKTGFQHYYGRTEYEAAHGTDDFDGTWAIWDEPFLQYYAEEMSKMKEPFMTAVFTASSHHPFVVPEKYKQQYPEEALLIHKCIRYTDMSIGRFFQTASRQPWFKNTIFVLTSDHANMSDHAEYQTDLGGFCSPIIIYDPSNPVGVMHDKIAQQIDILPTVLGLLGYDKGYFGFGIDVLNTPQEDTWAVNYLNGIYQYVKQGYVLQFDGHQTRAVYALSDSLMQHNLLNKVQSSLSESVALRTKIKVQSQMERELKAIIQQYMERMKKDKLRND